MPRLLPGSTPFALLTLAFAVSGASLSSLGCAGGKSAEDRQLDELRAAYPGVEVIEI